MVVLCYVEQRVFCIMLVPKGLCCRHSQAQLLQPQVFLSLSL